MRDAHSPRMPLAAAALGLLALVLAFLAVYHWPGSATSPAVGTRGPGPAAPARALHAGPTLGASAPGAAAEASPSTPSYHPRDEREWQGMRVDMSMRALCEGARSCGLAAACLDGQCGPCESDSQCGDGEVCVLDHCVIARNVECRTRRDCTGDALCVLNGYSSDPRGNGEMRASCLEPRGGAALPDDLPLPEGIPAPPSPVDGSALLESVRAHAANPPEGTGARGE